MRPVRIVCVLALALLIAVAGAARADVPDVMSYQGVLRDDVGNVVADGDYTLTFGIYDVDSGGTALWSEDQVTSVSGGIFNVTLGTVTPLGLDFDVQYWLGIAVEHGTELTPRVRLTTAPYAFRAAVAESLVGGVGADSDWLYSGDDIYRLTGAVGVGTSSPSAKLHVDVDAETAGRFESSGLGAVVTLEVANAAGNAAMFEAGSPVSSYPGVPTAVFGHAGGSGNAGHFIADGTGTGLLTFSSSAGSALHAGANGTGYSGFFTGGAGVRVVGQCDVDGFQMATGASTGHVLTSDGSGAGTWQAPAALPDDDWTISGDNIYRLDGYVGVGLTSPGRTLHLKEDGDYTMGIYIENDDTGPGSSEAIGFLTEDGGGGITLYDDLSTFMPSGMSVSNNQYPGGIQFRTGGNQRLLIGGNGNVGIDEPNPAERLDVGGTVQMDGFQLTDSPGNGYVLVSDATGTGTWQPPTAVADSDWLYSGDDIYRLTGEVGVGTSSPSAKLHVDVDAETAGRFESSGLGAVATLEVANSAGNAAMFEAGSPVSSYPGVPTAVFGHTGGSGNAGHFIADGTGTGLLTFSNSAASALHAAANGSGYSGYFTGGSGVRVDGQCYVNAFRMDTGASSGRVLTTDGSGFGTWQAPAAVPDDDWTVYSGGVYRLDGYVGVGLASPGRTLHIKEDCDYTMGIYIENDDTGPGSSEAVHFLTEDGGGGIILYDDLSTFMPSGMSIWNGQYYGGIQFRTGGVHRLLIGGNGNVGIDEPNPSERLDVGGMVQMEGFRLTDSPGNGYVLVSDPNGTGTWQPPTAVADADWTISGIDMYSGVAGDVGIGTSSPTARLDISASGTTEGLNLEHAGTPGRVVNLERTSVPGSANDILQIKVPAGSPDDAQFIECERGASALFQVATDGSVTANGGGTFNGSVDITGALAVDYIGICAGNFAASYVAPQTHVVHGEVTGTGTSDAIAVYGLSTPSDNYGIGGYFEGGYRGVVGSVTQTGAGYIRGVWGTASGGSGNNYGVYGSANGGTMSFGIYGVASGASSSDYAGYFSGNVHVSGTLSKSSGSFKIDHPLDPANKYLSHSFVESPDMMNVYNGNVVTDGAGEAWVELPEWFEVLNRDFRYQLTCIGGFAPVYVAEKISGNGFKIAGGEPGMEVSWQVTGVRQDKYAEAHPIVVEETKPAHEAGKYLHPDLYGLPETARVDYVEEREVVIEPSERAPKPERVWDPTDGE